MTDIQGGQTYNVTCGRVIADVGRLWEMVHRGQKITNWMCSRCSTTLATPVSDGARLLLLWRFSPAPNCSTNTGARRHVCIKCICLSLEVAVVLVFGKVIVKEALPTDFAPLKLSSMPRLMTGQCVTNAVPHRASSRGSFQSYWRFRPSRSCIGASHSLILRFHCNCLTLFLFEHVRRRANGAGSWTRTAAGTFGET